MIIGCTTKNTYFIYDKEGNIEILNLYSDSTFKHKINKEIIYKGKWEVSIMNGDTIYTKATIVNENPLSNFISRIYVLKNNTPFLIDYTIE